MVMLTTKRFRLKDLVIYSSLILSGMYGVTHAALPIYDEFKKNPSAVEVIKQSDKVTTMLAVGQQQTARTPADIGKHRIAAMTERMAADQAVYTARTIVQAVEDATFGVGLSPTMTCGVVEEKQSHTTKQELSSQVRTAVSQSNAAMHFSKDGDRRAMRAKHHYENYCDITEMATGACLVSGNRRGGMNTDYSNIHNNLTLTDEQIDASYGFMHNIIDPAKSDYSFCTTLACEAVSQTEAQYHALGSMVQNSFLSQIQDSIAYDTPPGGAKTITVEQKGTLSEPWDGRLARWGETVYIGGGMGGGTYSLEGMVASPEIRALLEGISHGEAKSPEAFNRGQSCGWGTHPSGDGVTKITSMTPQQLLDRYNTNRSGNYKSGNTSCSSRLFATGLFQTIPSTLNELLRVMPQYRNQPYTAEVQALFALQLLKQNGDVNGFLTGRHNDVDRAVYGVSKIWASIAVPAGKSRASGLGISNGSHSYYAGGNKANAQSTAMVKRAFEAIKAKRS